MPRREYRDHVQKLQDKLQKHKQMKNGSYGIRLNTDLKNLKIIESNESPDQSSIEVTNPPARFEQNRQEFASNAEIRPLAQRVNDIKHISVMQQELDQRKKQKNTNLTLPQLRKIKQDSARVKQILNSPNGRSRSR